MKELNRRLRGISEVFNGERGFTMIELAMVLVIIGILVAVAVPTYQSMINKAHTAEARGLLAEVRTAAWTYYLENDAWPGAYDSTEDGKTAADNELGINFQNTDYDFEWSTVGDDSGPKTDNDENGEIQIRAIHETYEDVQLTLYSTGKSAIQTGDYGD